MVGRLGAREKAVLLLMLRSDDPPGKPNPLWFDIYREFGIDYDSLPKKYQLKFREERKFRLSIHRLIKKDLMRAVSFLPDGFSVPDPRGFGYSFYCLTSKGRKMAEKLLYEENANKSYEGFEKAIAAFRVQGSMELTLMGIYDAMWPLVQDKFESRKDFEKYWNPHKIGFLIKKHASKRSHISMKDGRRKYILQQNDTISSKRIT